MLVNKIAPPMAFIIFVAFFAVILWKVPRIDLAVIVGIGIAAVLYDLFETAMRDARARRTTTLDR